jgi:glycyl-tRNA synthetase (class II)
MKTVILPAVGNFYSNLLSTIINVLQGKRIVCTILEECLVVPEGSLNLSSLAPCSHEEADTRILLHLANAVACGHISVLIRTNDSDVVVLAVRVTQILKNQTPRLSVWIGFGTGNNYR